MKILANVPLGFKSFVYEKLSEAGHEVIEFDDEVLIADVVDTFERERPDVFFWDPGAPTFSRFSMVESVMRQLGQPPTVFVSVMPEEWAAHCSEKYQNVRIAELSFNDYEEVLAAAVAAKAA